MVNAEDYAKQIKEFAQVNRIERKKKIDIKRLMSKMNKYEVLVGIPANGSNRSGEENITNAQLAFIHTHGTTKKAARAKIEEKMNEGMNYGAARKEVHQMWMVEHGSPAYAIPPRPIIEPAIEKNREEIQRRLVKAATEFLKGNENAGEEELEKVGMFAQNKVRAYFTDSDNGWAPNSPATIKAKGSDKPLIDTGELRKSITYVIKK